MRYEFMMAGNDLAGPANVASTGGSIAALNNAFAAQPAPMAPRPKKPKVIYDTIRLPVRGTRAIGVRGGVPMQGPATVKLMDAKPTLSLSRALGTKLALAGLGLGALDPRLGKQIRTLHSSSLKAKPVTLMPVSTGTMIPGLGDGSGFMPGLGGGGFMPGLGALDRRIPGPKTRKLTARTSKATAESAGKMLPGLACDDPDHVVSAGQLSADDLYDQMEGVGMNAWSGMPTPGMTAPGMPGIGAVTLPVIGELTVPKMIAAAALLAFFTMARKRYA